MCSYEVHCYVVLGKCRITVSCNQQAYGFRSISANLGLVDVQVFRKTIFEEFLLQIIYLIFCTKQFYLGNFTFYVDLWTFYARWLRQLPK